MSTHALPTHSHRSLLALCLALLGIGVGVSPAAADLGENDVGINTHLPANDLLDMCVDLGVTWIRIDANWRDIHTGPGAFNWTEMDRVVDEAGTRGLAVYMTLAYTPDWVTRVPRTRTDTYGGNDEPSTSAEWVAFVEAAVGRYSARGVTHYGIWNEPNLDGFWESGADPYIDKILIPGADAVARTCASCLVLGPDLAHVGAYDAFLDRVMTRAGDRFDILAHHIYQGWDVAVWDGDSFLNALEMRRFTFTRASLREILDAHGWTGEVWITETGYRASSIGDAADEDRQATYVRRVLEEQLARPWWTNSFFYEITDCGVDQPGCPIDGVGITRPSRPVSSGGPRSFPADYRLKPAYTTLKGFIVMHPEIVTRATPPQCANGMDDDGDGRIDSEDRGCVTGTDDDESDDPARRTHVAARAPTPTVADGDLSDWGATAPTLLSSADWTGQVSWGGPDDLTASLDARWTEDSIWIAVVVRDQTHVATDPDDQLYLGDSLQLAFDMSADYSPGAYDADDHELTFALRDGTTVAGHRFHGTGSDAWEVGIVRAGTQTTYEVRLPAAVLGAAAFADGTSLGFSMLVNDDDGVATDDGTGREGWLQLTPGIGSGKDPYAFGTLALRASAPPLDGGASDGGVAPTDGGFVTLPDGNVVPADGGSTPPSSEGCSCRAVGGRGASAPWALVALGLGFFVRRRRRR